jgi:hypothetical protein
MWTSYDCDIETAFVSRPDQLHDPVIRQSFDGRVVAGFEEETSMVRRTTVKSLVPALAGAFMVASAAFAQTQPPSFDGPAFFQQLEKVGFKAPAGFDPKKFFEELEKQRFSNNKKFDGKAFFDELEKQRFTAPANFDSQKFWAEMSRETRLMPPMVEIKR